MSIFQLENRIAPEQAAHIWIVIGFFQRLALLVEHNKIHREMTLEFFGELFIWWWVASFERQLSPCDCDARNRILELKLWFYQNTTDDKRARWIQRALSDLAQAIDREKMPIVFVE